MDSDKTTDKSPSTTSSNSPHLAFTAISNVKLHVPIQLSFSQPNYKKWCRLFLLLVRRFNLHGFLSGSKIPSSANDDEWFQLDALLQGWILSTVTDEVSDLVISSTSTASELWRVIHDLFHDNKPARAMQLEHQFRTTVKGTMPMATYCQTLRNIADWLDDVDAPVSESQLVLQLLRGLPDDLQAQTSWMQFQQPQPNFLQVRSALLLLERQRSHSIETGTALVTGRTGGQPGPNQQQQPHGRTSGAAEPAGNRGYPGRGGGGRGGHGRGRGRGRSSGGQRHSDGYGPWNSPNQNPNPTPGGVMSLGRDLAGRFSGGVRGGRNHQFYERSFVGDSGFRGHWIPVAMEPGRIQNLTKKNDIFPHHNYSRICPSFLAMGLH
ncbi:hypothetical protein DM860_000691 [Cuscuta australis]|uniref:Retrotransposon Copia-like N-terminal domain-containing protein n=1 Tax=Cuscuta australis TaxID=267555 RepID=A0A328CWY8_9ASTE|nr:hypothetical protein DM860_000691 [Cuscuta australis]